MSTPGSSSKHFPFVSCGPNVDDLLELARSLSIRSHDAATLLMPNSPASIGLPTNILCATGYLAHGRSQTWTAWRGWCYIYEAAVRRSIIVHGFLRYDNNNIENVHMLDNLVS